MEWLFYWFLSGIIGVCIITYYDAKHNINSNNHLLEFLTVAFIAGFIVFIFALFVLVQEFHITTHNNT
jgi:hypothetical protein